MKYTGSCESQALQMQALTAVNVAGSPGAEQWRTAGQAGFATESRQGRPSQQADARPLPAPASSPTASTSGREVAELRQQVADLQAQNRQLLQMTRQQQATMTLLQACTSYLVLWDSMTLTEICCNRFEGVRHYFHNTVS